MIDYKKGEKGCPSLSGCGGGGGGLEGTCCVCHQEDGCACKNGAKDFKCVDGFWKIEVKNGSDYSSFSGGGGGSGSGVWNQPSEGCGAGGGGSCRWT